MVEMALIVVGFLVFAAGVIWFSSTIVRRRPLQSFPGGIGLLVMALAGAVMMISGGLMSPGEEQEKTPSIEETSTALGALRKQVSSQSGELAALGEQLGRLEERLDKADGQIEDLRGRLDAAETREPEPDLEPAAEEVPALALDGPVIAHSASLTSVDYITFQVTNASQASETPELSESGTVVSYLDSDQGVSRIDFKLAPASSGGNAWGVRWLVGTGPELDAGERAEITVNLTGLRPPLGANKEFIIEIKPAKGPVLTISSATPDTLGAKVELK